MIAALETPGANATVRRMAALARGDALPSKPDTRAAGAFLSALEDR